VGRPLRRQLHKHQINRIRHPHQSIIRDREAGREINNGIELT
jgi:hypothetical protein